MIVSHGIVGALIATVVALPIKVIYCNYVADKVILKRPIVKTVSILGVNWLLFAIVVVINPFLNLNIDSYLSFALYGGIVFVVISVISVLLNAIVNKDLLKIKTILKK